MYTGRVESTAFLVERAVPRVYSVLSVGTQHLVVCICFYKGLSAFYDLYVWALLSRMHYEGNRVRKVFLDLYKK